VTAAAEKGKLQVAAPPESAPGVAWLRLYNADGVSALRPIFVGPFAESVEAEPNDRPAQCQLIELPRVVCGRLAKRGDADCFRVRLKQGEQLVAAGQASQLLGSPVDAVLQICQLRTRVSQKLGLSTEEAYVLEENHDLAGLDPRAVCTAPADGDYLVRIFGFPSEPDSGIALAGNNSYVYRLTLTTGEYIEQTMPSAIERSMASSAQRPILKLFGRTIRDANATFDLNLQTENLLALDERSLLAFHPQWPGEIPLMIVDHPVLLAAQESSMANPQSAPSPVTICGRLQTPHTAQVFRIPMQKDAKQRITVQSRVVGASLYPAVEVIDSRDKHVSAQKADSTQRDFSFVFAPPADGEYRLRVSDTGDQTGETGFYRLTIEPAAPDFALALSPDSTVLTAGTPLEVPVTIQRTEGFAEPIEIRATDLPAGVVADPILSQPEGDSAKQVKLIIKSDAAAAAFNGPIAIRGRSTGPSGREHAARYNVGLPGAGSRSDLWLTVKPAGK
jgi:hypothetical protein